MAERTLNLTLKKRHHVSCLVFESSKGSPSEGCSPPRNPPRKSASQRGSLWPLWASVQLCGGPARFSKRSDPMLVTLGLRTPQLLQSPEHQKKRAKILEPRENTPKIPPKYPKRAFFVSRGYFSVFSGYFGGISGRCVLRYFLRKFWVGPSRRSVAGQGVLNCWIVKCAEEFRIRQHSFSQPLWVPAVRWSATPTFCTRHTEKLRYLSQ